MNKKIFISALLACGLAAGAWLAWSHFRGPDRTKLPSITLKQHGDSEYSLEVDGHPYLVKGVCYMPVPTGETYDYNFWAKEEIWKTDGKMMKEMGVNTVRFYRPGRNPAEVRAFINGLYSKFGIRSMMGHDLGFWDWPPPNYGTPAFRERVKREVLAMVEQYKNEPGILAWILGNENNYSFEIMNVQSWTTPELEQIEDLQQRAKEKASIYYSFVNDLAQEIKKIDPVRPVIMGVGEVKSLDIASQFAPAIDIIGMIVYRGPGFGNLFSQIRERFDKPVMLIEWGADSYDVAKDQEAQDKQAEFMRYQWRDMLKNTAGQKSGVGNCLGGTAFEWHDEWWKANEHVEITWLQHDTAGQFSNAAYYFDYDQPNRLNMNEEWYGVVALEPSEGRIDARKPKKAFYTLKELWTS